MRTSRPGRSASGCVRSCLGAAGCAAELATNCAALHVATADAIAAAVATVTYDATGPLLRVNMDRSSRLSPDRRMNVFRVSIDHDPRGLDDACPALAVPSGSGALIQPAMRQRIFCSDRFRGSRPGSRPTFNMLPAARATYRGPPIAGFVGKRPVSG